MIAHTTPTRDWAMALSDILHDALDGDTIVVPDAATKELAERARSGMWPHKDLTIVVQSTDNYEEKGS